MKELGTTEVQALAILDLRLQRLTGMEREKIHDERQLLIRRIKEIEKILSNDDEINSE